jgi:hypothetical protein
MRPEWVWNIHRQMCATCAVWKNGGIQLIDEKTCSKAEMQPCSLHGMLA